MDNLPPWDGRLPRRIAIFRATFLGDLLCSLPAFRALRLAYPDAEITLIGLPWAREFVERIPYLDHFEEFQGYPGIVEVPYEPMRSAAGVSRARAAGYDLAIQMHGDGNISNEFVAQFDARLSLGFCPGPDDRLDLTLFYDRTEHEVLRCLQLVGMLRIPAAVGPVEFPIAPTEDMHADQLLAEMPRSTSGPLVGLHPGAKVSSRRWPPARFAELGDILAEQLDAQIVLTGSAGEEHLTAAVREAMHAPVLDLVDKTSLGVFAALLRRLDLFITNDTGASHLASVIRTPSIVLFGQSRPREWGPLDRERHRVVDAASIVGPGVDREAALANLPVPPVLAACRDVVQRRDATGAG